MSVNFLTTSAISLSLLFNGPAGHDLLNQIGLRIAFWNQWQAANDFSGKSVSFDTFRENSPLYLMAYYDGDMDKVEQDIVRLGALSALCLTSGEEDDPNAPSKHHPPPCHAVNPVNRKRKKDSPADCLDCS